MTRGCRRRPFAKHTLRSGPSFKATGELRGNSPVFPQRGSLNIEIMLCDNWGQTTKPAIFPPSPLLLLLLLSHISSWQTAGPTSELESTCAGCVGCQDRRGKITDFHTCPWTHAAYVFDICTHTWSGFLESEEVLKVGERPLSVWEGEGWGGGKCFLWEARGTTKQEEEGWGNKKLLQTAKTQVKQVPKSTPGHRVSQVRIHCVFREITLKMSKGTHGGVWGSRFLICALLRGGNPRLVGGRSNNKTWLWLM